MNTDDDQVRVYGPEPWDSVAGRDWSWWDLWCCTIAIKDHGGELSALAGEIADRIRSNRTAAMFYGRDSDDARLSHVLDLDQRLHTAGLDPSDLANPAVLADRKITSRARAKVQSQHPLRRLRPHDGDARPSRRPPPSTVAVWALGHVPV